ncbi:MAG: S9 family peptidase [Actinomycetota bacterium]|nr:S9 family peptidase [Actinomycetota bacterium]
MSPPLPDHSPLELFRALLRTRSAVLADVAKGEEERVLLRSDAGGTMQLFEYGRGELAALSDLPEPVASARYVPGSDRIVVALDRGGDERHQLYLLDRAKAAAAPCTSLGELDALTGDPRYAHQDAGISPDGRVLAYVSNRASGVHFDVWLCDLEQREHRLVYGAESWCHPASGFSPDGRYLSVAVPGNDPLDVELVLIEVATGRVRAIAAHPDEAALVGPPAWLDADRFVFSSNLGRDFAALCVYDLRDDSIVTFEGTGIDADAEVATSDDGSVIVCIENRNGASALSLHDEKWTAAAAVPLADRGAVSSYQLGTPQLSSGGERLYYSLSSPTLPPDVWCFERTSGKARRLSDAAASLPDHSLASAEEASVESFDGERIALFVFRPERSDPAPVVVLIHGGPESQSLQSFNPVIQGLVAAGYGVVVPNVRGSTGYGKRFAALDDTRRRLDSVRDLEAVHRFCASAGFDADRAALWGGSYGGYMVLAGLAFQPERWAAGVDIVGISDLVTFLERTSDYRRAHREREYGSLAHDRDFLASASPLRHVEHMVAPLFVIHGRNDPRVPLSEAEQLVAALAARQVPCELAIYDDEGHGLARLANRLDAYPRAVAFLDRVLGS